MWLGGIFKHYWLESGGWRWLHQSSQMSQDKIFSISSAEDQVSLALWQAEAAGLGMADEVTTSTAGPALLWSSYSLSIHSWDSTISNRHLSHHPVPLALTITQAQHLRMLMTDKPWSLISCPKPPQPLSFTLAIGKYRERKAGKIWANPPRIFSLCNVPM